MRYAYCTLQNLLKVLNSAFLPLSAASISRKEAEV
jgi:hypothetical protein